ncbi:MAG: precorrin-2 C(20)-methyltransferase [Paludibacter sp.]|nr:precorrin-2 C(20)-methyltransferase [Paludibacter sp.]
MNGIFYGIGVGPGDPDLLTVKAVKVLAQVDVLAIPESTKEGGSVAYDIAKPHLKSDVSTLSLTFPMIKDEVARQKFRYENAMLIKEQIEAGKNVAFLTLGDPLLYSTYIYLLDYLKDSGIEIVTVPGIYSFSAISSVANLPIVKGDESLALISSFDKSDWSHLNQFDTIVCMKISSYNEALYNVLKNDGTYSMLLTTNAGKTTQYSSTDIEELTHKLHYFTTVILTKINT